MVAAEVFGEPEPARPGVAPVAVPVHRRRVVAVAATATELLRPESDLLRIISGIPQVDLLLVGGDLPAGVPCAVRVLGPGLDPQSADGTDPDGRDLSDGDPDDADLDETGPDGADRDDADVEGPGDRTGQDEVAAAVANLGVPGLHLHRLDLPTLQGPSVESDLVAALSELVGFDPEPGVYCLAPAPLAGDPGRTVINRAALRIARVYGLPLLRYRCLELAVVED